MPGRGLAQEQPAHHDREWRDEVGRDAQAAGGHVPQREGERREGDRRREEPEVDHPPDVGRRRVAGVVDELPGERQADDRADRARQPRDVDRRQPRDQRLLHDQADRVHQWWRQRQPKRRPKKSGQR